MHAPPGKKNRVRQNKNSERFDTGANTAERLPMTEPPTAASCHSSGTIETGNPFLLAPLSSSSEIEGERIRVLPLLAPDAI